MANAKIVGLNKAEAGEIWQVLYYDGITATKKHTPLLIRLFLILLFAALSLFLSIDVLLWLGIPGLPSIVAKLGVAVMLLACALLVGAGLIGLAKSIILCVCTYFSASQRAQRRLWFVQAKQDQLRRLHHFKSVQLRYVYELKRNHLLKANNRKHIQALSKAIHKDLQTVKAQLPVATFKQLKQEHRQYRKQQNIPALIQLQQKIAGIEA